MTLRTSCEVTTRWTPRRARVDRFDAGVGDRAAEDLAVQHAGEPHGVGIFGASGHLLARLEPRQRASDLRAHLGADLAACSGRHQWVAPSSAWRAARAT